MSGCNREEEMEELALGNLSPARARAAREHLVVCVACAEAHRLFESEQALFGERAAAIVAPPLALTARPRDFRFAPKADKARDLWSVTRVVAAAFACAAAIVCVVRDKGAAPYAAAVSETAAEEKAQKLHASAAPAFEEGLACAYPASGFARSSLATFAPARRAGFSSLEEDRVAICEDNAISISGP